MLSEKKLDELVRYVEQITEPYIVASVHSQLHPKEWLEMLTSGSGVDPDIHYILDGITHGFRVVDQNIEIEGYCCPNYSSCFSEENKSKLEVLISKEIESGKLTITTQKPKCVHALGVISKKESNKIRPITDCRRPLNESINNYMDDVWDSFQFVSFDHVVARIVEGKKYFLSTLDIANAYRSILIHPENRQYFGLKMGNKFMLDNFLCFGCKSAPFVFNRVTDSICRYLRDVGVEAYNYLDDIICLSDSYEQGVVDQLFVIKLLRRLGFYLAWQKISSPSRKCIYLGVEIDTVEMCMCLPDAKVQKIKKELKFWEGRRKATLKQLQRLIGLLGHAARIIRGGKLYINFLLEKLIEAKLKRKVKLKDDFHDDISWWKTFLDMYNCTPLCDVFGEVGWLSMFSMLGSVRVSSWEFDCEVIIHDSFDNMLTYQKIGLNYHIYIPDEIAHDDVGIELSVLWMFCMENAHLTNCSLIFFCNRKMLWLSLKKKRYKSMWANLILRHIFWWTMRQNINWIFMYRPVDHVHFRYVTGATW